jgi:mRNA export factor
MHPIHATFSTAGSDGSFTFWDMLDKRRLKSFAPAPVTASAQAGSSTTATIGGIGGKTDKDKAAEAAGKTAITATGFNGDGSLFAYAVGYDWSKGYAESKAGREDRVMLHVVGNECSPVSGAVKR